VNRIRVTLGLIVVVAFISANARAQWKTPWDYEGARGPDHWSTLDPAYAACAGKEQSPIDIRDAQKAKLPALQFEYKPEPLKYLINNGHTIRVNYHDAKDAGSYVTFDGTRYQLTQFHFHRPSEELIDGKVYDMVAHFMHQSSDGKTMGIAVLLKEGKSNPTIQKLWDHMPVTEGSEHEVPGVAIDPSGLLPKQMDYYMYSGSLTAPPCTEGITWFVLKMPVEVSPKQIEAFSKLYPHDVRPVQPLNGRVVKESQ